MNGLLLCFRGAFFLAAMLLFGESAFRSCVERLASAGWAKPFARWRAGDARFWIFSAALAVAGVAAIGWFAVEVSVMTGGTIDGEAIKRALFQTTFGRISLLRVALAGALALVLWRERRIGVVHGVLALGLLLSAAATGHAMSEQGTDRLVHLCADSLHLLGAAAWVGALPALALVLLNCNRGATADAYAFAAAATRRFSLLGVASVSVLVVSGTINAWYTVGSVPALFGTDYGKLLIAKLALVAAMVALAATNRFRFTPRLAGSGDRSRKSAALRGIRVNATAEFMLGIAVIAVVAALGVVIPGAHTQVIWPFAYTLNWGQAASHAASIALLLAAAVLLLAIARRVGVRTARALYAAVPLASAAIAVWLFAAPANPGSYLRSPVRYSAQSIARGKQVFDQHCASCHGREGRGDGPLASSLSPRPVNLVEHLLHHREGDVWWWIAHGIPQTAMPAFGERIAGRDIWNVVNLLHARADAHAAGAISDKVGSSAVAAPDFTFEIGRQGEEALSDERGRHAVLLVFLSPRGLDRLRTLSNWRADLERAGVRVIAMPTGNGIVPADSLPGTDVSLVAGTDPAVLAAYRIFARSGMADGEPISAQVEYLIDREGYIRARWAYAAAASAPGLSYLLEQVSMLAKEPAHPLLEHHHGS